MYTIDIIQHKVYSRAFLVNRAITWILCDFSSRELAIWCFVCIKTKWKFKWNSCKIHIRILYMWQKSKAKTHHKKSAPVIHVIGSLHVKFTYTDIFPSTKLPNLRQWEIERTFQLNSVKIADNSVVTHYTITWCLYTNIFPNISL